MSSKSGDRIAEIHATLDRFAKLIAESQAKADARQAKAERSAEELRAQIKETSAVALQASS